MKIAKPDAPWRNSPDDARIHLGFLEDYEQIESELSLILSNITSKYPQKGMTFLGVSFRPFFILYFPLESIPWVVQ